MGTVEFNQERAGMVATLEADIERLKKLRGDMGRFLDIDKEKADLESIIKGQKECVEKTQVIASTILGLANERASEILVDAETKAKSLLEEVETKLRSAEEIHKVASDRHQAAILREKNIGDHEGELRERESGIVDNKNRLKLIISEIAKMGLAL